MPYTVADEEGLADLRLKQLELLVVCEIQPCRGRIGRSVIGQEDSHQKHTVVVVDDAGDPPERLDVCGACQVPARPVVGGYVDAGVT